MRDMTDIKLKVAEALYPALDAFQAIERQLLQSVWQIDNEGNTDRFVFCFETISLIVAAEIDYDTVNFWSESGVCAPQQAANVSGSETWRESIGKTFGWGWVTVNQQGYCDGILLSFGSITPQVLLNVVASSINVHVVANQS